MSGKIKGIVFASILVSMAASAYGDPQFRLAATLAADFARRPTMDDVRTVFDDQGELFWGTKSEVIIDRVGIGMNALVNFDQALTGFEDPLYDWSLDWLGDFYLSYHFFGGGAFIDPFVEIGFGNAGRVNLDESTGDWYQVDGEWKYTVDTWDPNDEALENLALYPFVGAGLALDLDGLLIGARLSYRPTVLPIPATQFDVYPLTTFQVSVFGGVALGGH